jgi:arabinogalactan oligomer/maltooligosaccharide transport system substrate-binding protein
MKKLLALLLALVMVLSLAACAQTIEEEEPAAEKPAEEKKDDAESTTTEEADEPAEEEMPEGWNADTEMYPFEDGATLKVWADNEDYGEALVAAWDAKGYGVTLEYEIVGSVDQRQKLELDGPAGIGADVIQVPHDHVTTLIDAGIVMELQPEFTAVLQDRLLETAMQTANVDGAQYGASIITESIALFYNKDLVGDFMPATFEELVEWAADYKAETGNWGLGWQVEDAYHNYFFLTAFGMRVFGENSMDADNPGWDSDAAAKGLEFYKSVRTDAFDVPGPDAGWDTTVAAFQKGEMPFTITGPWAIGDANNNGVNFGITKIPTIAGNQPYTFSGAQIILVSAYTEYPNAANNLISFMASEEGLGLLYSVNGKLPAVKDASSIPGLADDALLSGIAEQANFSYPMPVIKEIQFMWGPQADLFKFVWNGDLTIPEAQAKAIEDYGVLRSAAE